MAMTDTGAWQDGFVAMATVERCGPGRYCFSRRLSGKRVDVRSPREPLWHGREVHRWRSRAGVSVAAVGTRLGAGRPLGVDGAGGRRGAGSVGVLRRLSPGRARPSGLRAVDDGRAVALRLHARGPVLAR